MKSFDVTHSASFNSYFRNLMIGLVAAIAIASVPNATFAADDNILIFQGASCQALHGADEPNLTHNADWLTSKVEGTWVICPLVRDIKDTNKPANALVRVYRPNGAYALDCTFYAVKLDAGVVFLKQDSAPVGWSWLDLTLPGNAHAATYSVRCKLPDNAKFKRLCSRNNLNCPRDSLEMLL
jgi:hypothetical protein